MVAVSTAVQAQRLVDLMKPVPAAITNEAAMPEQMARKFARLKTERHDKLISPSTNVMPKVCAQVMKKKEQFVLPGKETFGLRYQPTDRYTVAWPDLKLVNSSHGREKIKDEGGKFNPKKDRISYAVIRDGRICIVNHSHKLVDMSDFRFTPEEEGISMNGNEIDFSVSLLSIAAGYYPWTYKIKCEHLSSDAQYTFDLRLEWRHQMDLAGQFRAFALTPMVSQTADDLGLLCDLENKQFHVVRLPFLIDGEGKDGKDGRRGHTGANGTNETTYKDSDGKTHRIAGTCGTRGQDGEDGEDGTDGGQYLLCISPDLLAKYGEDGLVATIDAGQGGKGGKGGQGGRHGTGSGCSGKAQDGKDGRDGKDGVRGDFLYVLADVDAFYKDIMKGAEQ